MLTILGRRLFLTARVKKRCAARRSRLAVSKKSTVFPCLSTARYQYRSSPRILMYVSSNLQLLPTAPKPRLRFRLRNASSSTGTSLMTHRGMIDEHVALLRHLFEIAQTQRVGDIPPHAHQHDVQSKALPLDHASDAVHDRSLVASTKATAL